jgi:hypothetical protein
MPISACFGIIGVDVMDEVGLELEGGENALYLGDAGRSCFAQ